MNFVWTKCTLTGPNYALHSDKLETVQKFTINKSLQDNGTLTSNNDHIKLLNLHELSTRCKRQKLSLSVKEL